MAPGQLIHTDSSEVLASPIANPRAASRKSVIALEWKLLAACMAIITVIATLYGMATSSLETAVAIISASFFSITGVFICVFTSSNWKQSVGPRLAARTAQPTSHDPRYHALINRPHATQHGNPHTVHIDRGMEGDTYLQIISVAAGALECTLKDISVIVHKTVTLEFGVTEQQMDDVIDDLYAEAEHLELQSHADRAVKFNPPAIDEPDDLADEQHLRAVQLVRARQISR